MMHAFIFLILTLFTSNTIWTVNQCDQKDHHCGQQACDNDDQCNKTCCDDRFFCKTFLLPRSLASDTGRRLLARHYFINEYRKNGYHTTAISGSIYTQSFNNEKTGNYFSPECISNCFTIGANDENLINVRSEDFGISCTGSICLCPKFQAWTTDLSLFYIFNPCDTKIFLDIHFPVVHIEWDNKCCITQLDECDRNFSCGLMSTLESETAIGTTKIDQALSGQFLWGDVLNVMEFGKFKCGKEDPITRVAEIEIGVGTWLAERDCWNIWIKALGKIPTGNHSKARSLLDPIAGNGGYAEAGLGLLGYALLWENECNKKLMVNFLGQATHLFSRTQRRLFDLNKNGCFSRYLLLKKYKDNGTQYNCLERGPNIFTHDIATNINVQVDASILLSYLHDCFLFDVGYNFWGRSEEKLDRFCSTITPQTYGIKGIIPVIPGTDDPDDGCVIVDPNDTNLQTASLSTIGVSKGKENGTDGLSPVFIKTDDLNLCSALAPEARSHTIFANLTWIWPDHERSPFFGLGGKLEFATTNSSLDVWAFWLRSGLNF